MGYQLQGGVWELTMACNMRCKHCGSSCTNGQEDELTTQEALDLCDQLADMGMKFLTLSGGELTLRNDWLLIAERLTERGITTSIITNGWLLTEELIQKAKDAGIVSIGISIDGLQKTHDEIRRPGSFDRDIQNIKRINAAGIYSCAITTIHEGNFSELEDMYHCFVDAGVNIWQLQLALPMGNFSHHKDLNLKQEHVSDIIDFCYSKKDGPIYMCPADSVGYCTEKENILRGLPFHTKITWSGCPAGKQTLGILCNGDIVGCTSIRDKQFVAGNIRNTPLADIWNSSESFRWNRALKKKDLKGFCGDCVYGSTCLGGCTNTRYCFGQDIYSENEYCAWNQDMKECRDVINDCEDEEELRTFAYDCLQKKQYQPALLATKKLIQLKKDTLLYYEWYAYLHFQIRDYETCMALNEYILKEDASNNTALKGLGLAVYMSGSHEKGIQILKDSLAEGTADNYIDLYSIMNAQGCREEADRIRKEAMERFAVDITA